MKKRDWPEHAGYTSGRDFRSQKRYEVRIALKAIDDLRLGCAYTPAYEQIVEANKHLELAKALLSVERWKR